MSVFPIPDPGIFDRALNLIRTQRRQFQLKLRKSAFQDILPQTHQKPAAEDIRIVEVQKLARISEPDNRKRKMGASNQLNGASLPMANAILISGFICVGKTYFAKQYAALDSKYHVIDLDSASFTAGKGRFPDNYFEAIRKCIFEDEGDSRPKIILLSTHDLARVLLIELGIPFALVYPHMSLEQSWMKRIIGRDVNERRERPLAAFFQKEHRSTGKTRFSAFATQCWHEKGKSEDRLRHFVLRNDQFLCDVIDEVVGQMGSHEVAWECPAQQDVEAAAERVRALVEVRGEEEDALAFVEKEWAAGMEERVVNKMEIQKKREEEKKRKEEAERRLKEEEEMAKAQTQTGT
jgi:hypothetical protein